MCPAFIPGDENADFAEEKKMPKLTVYVYDVATGIGIPGVMVYLWKGPGGIEPPETADYSKPTDSEGKAVFDVYNGFRVSISNGRYEAADPYQAPPEEWKDVYSAIGAVGVVEDVTYPFPLRVRVAVAYPTRISISAPGKVLVNETFTISGKLEYQSEDGVWRPLAGRTVSLYCDGTKIGDVATGSDGSYLRTASIPSPGTYTLKAVYAGEGLGLAPAAAESRLTVPGAGLIASLAAVALGGLAATLTAR